MNNQRLSTSYSPISTHIIDYGLGLEPLQCFSQDISYNFMLISYIRIPYFLYRDCYDRFALFWPTVTEINESGEHVES